MHHHFMQFPFIPLDHVIALSIMINYRNPSNSVCSKELHKYKLSVWNILMVQLLSCSVQGVSQNLTVTIKLDVGRLQRNDCL